MNNIEYYKGVIEDKICKDCKRENKKHCLKLKYDKLKSGKENELEVYTCLNFLKETNLSGLENKSESILNT